MQAGDPHGTPATVGFVINLKSQFAVCIHRAREGDALDVALRARDRMYACEPGWLEDEQLTLRTTSLSSIVGSVNMSFLLDREGRL